MAYGKKSFNCKRSACCAPLIIINSARAVTPVPPVTCLPVVILPAAGTVFIAPNGIPFSQVFTANQSVIFNLIGALPTGLVGVQTSPTTFTIFGTPALLAAASFPITLVAANACGSTSSSSYTIDVILPG